MLCVANFTEYAMDAHGTAIYEVASVALSVSFAVVARCSGATCIWTYSELALNVSNFLNNDGASAVIWAAESRIAIDQCVFVGNGKTEVDVVDAVVDVANCIFDAEILRVVDGALNVVLPRVAPLAIAVLRTRPCGGGRRIVQPGRPREDPTPSPSALPVNDERTPEIVGIIFLCILLCYLILPVIFVLIKYRKRIPNM
jgi:hypothetical protein